LATMAESLRRGYKCEGEHVNAKGSGSRDLGSKKTQKRECKHGEGVKT
jgi:hypothetical protein